MAIVAFAAYREYAPRRAAHDKHVASTAPGVDRLADGTSRRGDRSRGVFQREAPRSKEALTNFKVAMNGRLEVLSVDPELSLLLAVIGGAPIAAYIRHRRTVP